MRPIVIMPQSLLNPSLVDEDYRVEEEVFRGLGAKVVRMSERFHLSSSVHPQTLGVYRGWMMTPRKYQIAYNQFLDNIRLINTPQEYVNCHWLPYAKLPNSLSPHMYVIPKKNIPDLDDLFIWVSRFFVDRPIVVRDYAKSQASLWEEACYIPHANDEDRFKQVMRGFYKWSDVEGGLVFRAFLFAPICAIYLSIMGEIGVPRRTMWS